MSTSPEHAQVTKISINPVKERLTTLIAKPMKLIGDILGSEGVMVRGEVQGDIIVSDDGPPDTGVVYVVAGGRVSGLIASRRVVVGGEQNGPVIARGVLQVTETGVVNGDVYCVEIDDGSITRVRGEVHRIGPGEDPIGEVQARRYA